MTRKDQILERILNRRPIKEVIPGINIFNACHMLAQADENQRQALLRPDSMIDPDAVSGLQ